MPKLMSGQWDSKLTEIAGALAKYEAARPDADVSLYRQNAASIRIRVIDEYFDGLGIGDRGKLFWPFLRSLSDDARSEISVLLLLTPEEVPTSFANADFACPVPSGL
ncbi:MAG: hypothetical protein AB7U97_07695 [Pirellulales bacterium]